jgi:hypothetical protein
VHVAAKEEGDGCFEQRRGDEALRGGLAAQRLGSDNPTLRRRYRSSRPGQRSSLAGDFSGKQAFLDYYGRVFAELGGTIEVVEFHDVLVSEDHAVALVKERAMRGEWNPGFNRVVVYHLRDAQIAETWSHDYDP